MAALRGLAALHHDVHVVEKEKPQEASWRKFLPFRRFADADRVHGDAPRLETLAFLSVRDAGGAPSPDDGRSARRSQATATGSTEALPPPQFRCVGRAMH